MFGLIIMCAKHSAALVFWVVQVCQKWFLLSKDFVQSAVLLTSVLSTVDIRPCNEHYITNATWLNTLAISVRYLVKADQWKTGLIISQYTVS